MSAAATPEHIFICSCEQSMPLDEARIRKGCGTAKLHVGQQFCRAEANRVMDIATSNADIAIACTQESATFEALLNDAHFKGTSRYFNIREMAGWSAEAAQTGPKMAALIATSHLQPKPVEYINFESQGVALIYGKDDVALDVATRLADTLDITVLLKSAKGITPPAQRDFPIVMGHISKANGHFTAFSLTIDDYALPSPASRHEFIMGIKRNGAESTCDLIIDVTDDTPLFSSPDLRDGYLRAAPQDRAGIEALIAKARDMIGTFDKPKYINFKPDLCAHSRSKITGCTRCLDLCPTGAIAPNGNTVSIDPYICAGCGGCAANCPTGAATFSMPTTEETALQIRTLLMTYSAAGGEAPRLLLYEKSHGEALINMLSRFGEGLPAHVLPLAVPEITTINVELLSSALAWGAGSIRILGKAKPKHDLLALNQVLETAKSISLALGFGKDAIALIETDDPDQIGQALSGAPVLSVLSQPAAFTPIGDKRQREMMSLRELANAAPLQPEFITLPKTAGFGIVEVDQSGCTLCHACVSACPVAALNANPERPMLTFSHDLCVQCGLCQATCPEKVITLTSGIDLKKLNAGPVVLHEEEPHHCDSCGKAFGTKATIARIRDKLSQTNHWMFSGNNQSRLALIGLCENCRVTEATNAAIDPYAGTQRPPVRTTEDYLRERLERGEEI